MSSIVLSQRAGGCILPIRPERSSELIGGCGKRKVTGDELLTTCTSHARMGMQVPSEKAVTNPKRGKIVDWGQGTVCWQGIMRVDNEATEVRGTQTGHFMLLDPSEAGRVYVNGRLVEKWSESTATSANSHHPGVFGYDLIGIEIEDVDDLKRVIGNLILEILIDAGQAHRDVAGMLLNRISHGCDEGKGLSPLDVSEPCLESMAMGDPAVDPVGISAKALATKFVAEHGDKKYPCVTEDITYVVERIGVEKGRDLVAVPQRMMAVLKRGGYLDLKRTDVSMWFTKMSCYKTLASTTESSENADMSALCKSGYCEVQQNLMDNPTPMPGEMTLYVKAGPDGKSVGDCPFAHFVRIVLEEKGLDYTLCPCTLWNKPQWLVEDHGGAMPALRHSETTYVESEFIAQHLDSFFSPMGDKEMMTQVQEVSNELFPPVARYLMHIPQGDRDDMKLKNDLKKALQKLENYLSNQPGPYTTEGLFNLVDASLGPKLYHMKIGLEAFKNNAVNVEEDFPAVAKYMGSIFARPSFIETLYPKETVIWGWSAARET